MITIESRVGSATGQGEIPETVSLLLGVGEPQLLAPL